jgi:hypothetical protein
MEPSPSLRESGVMFAAAKKASKHPWCVNGFVQRADLYRQLR